MTRVNEVTFAVVFLRFATVSAPEKDVDDDGHGHRTKVSRIDLRCANATEL